MMFHTKNCGLLDTLAAQQKARGFGGCTPRLRGSTTEGRILQILGAGDLTDSLVPDVDELVQTPFLLAADCLGADRTHH